MQTTVTQTKRLATERDVLGALSALGSLPKRETDQADLDLAAYLVALDGVGADALAQAVRRILQGVLNHSFYPSPPEFRLLCDRIAQEGSFNQRWEVIVRRERVQRKRYVHSKPSKESKARVAAMYAEFDRTWPRKGRLI